MTIAYLANSFPEALEPYVEDEIRELRSLGWQVVACSIKRPRASVAVERAKKALYVFPLNLAASLRASWACACNLLLLWEFIRRALIGPEPATKRVRALVHTWLGVYLAVAIRDRCIQHIHVHHGYFGSWVGMVAAKILGAGFSITLHGSDVLVRRDYLDLKLKHCRFCVTISQFNRCSILENYPEITAAKIIVHHLGIDTGKWRPAEEFGRSSAPLILSVGRLHAVKNHSFLIQACRELKRFGMKFRCVIAGEGEERDGLEALIKQLDLQHEMALAGYVARENLPGLYAQAAVVVLTSLSEGIPVALMEAMALEAIVLAPAITGISELIDDGENGFLYSPGCLEEFVHKLRRIVFAKNSSSKIRRSAREKIESEFNAALNLRRFATDFIKNLGTGSATVPSVETNENPVLQQI